MILMMEFGILSEDKILFTEMPGKLKVASLSDKSVNEIDNIPLVQYSGQGGLSDVALDPDFESNNMIYLSYSAKDKTKKQPCSCFLLNLMGMPLKIAKLFFKLRRPGDP